MDRARVVPLDRTLLEQGIALAADQDFIGICRGDDFAGLVLASPAIAVLEGGQLLGIGGFAILWPGMAEGWMLPSIFATRRHLTRVTREMRVWLDSLQQDPAFRRVEIRVKASAAWRETWTRAMGFGGGHLLEAWGPDGSDHFLHARVAPCAEETRRIAA